MNIERKVKISSSIRKTEQKLPQKKSPQTGTVVRRTKSFYYVDVGEATPRLCRIRGSLFKVSRHRNKIAVGDEVEIDLDVEEDSGWILGILPPPDKAFLFPLRLRKASHRTNAPRQKSVH